MGETEEKRSCQRPRRWLLTGVLWVVAAVSAYAQQVRVNHLTGSPVFSVPLWQVVSGDISYPVVLSYQSNGIRVGTGAGPVGMSWRISSGGTITRTVRGLPDDLNTATRKGWLYDSVAWDVQQFVSTADTDYTDATDEVTDYASLAAFGGFDSTSVMADTEPDLFYINVPGLSGKMVFDQSGQPVLVSLSDITIEATRDTDTGRITAFLLHTASGVTYHFDLVTTTTIRTSSENASDLLYGKNDYYAYKSGLTFNSTWYLTAITSAEGGRILFEYDKPVIKQEESAYHTLAYSPEYSDSLFTWHYSPLQDSYVKHSFYIKRYTVEQPYVLRLIKGGLYEVRFVSGLVSIPLEFTPPADWYWGPIDLRQPLIYSVSVYQTVRSVPSLVKRYIFDYCYYKATGLFPANTAWPTYYPFLKSLREASAWQTQPPYLFSYYGLNDKDSTTFLAGHRSYARDYFGYSNAGSNKAGQMEIPEIYVYPGLDDANRYRGVPIPGYAGEFYRLSGRNTAPGIRGLEAGMLASVIFPEGGKTTLIYEPNTYYDSLAGQDLYAGGLRVRELITHDGVDYSHDITVRYEYNTGQGRSSGKMLRMPQYSFSLGVHFNPDDSSLTYQPALTGSREEIWKKTIIRTRTDQNYDPLNTGPHVAYSVVTVRQPGIGYERYYFRLPLDYASQQAADWSVTPVRLARPGVSGSYNHYGQLMFRHNFPFASQTNYDYRQGMLQRREVYSEGDTLLSVVRYTYRPLTYRSLQAIRKDMIGTTYSSGQATYVRGMYVYSPYSIRLQTGLLPDSIKATTYNPDGYAGSMTRTTVNEYVFSGTPFLAKTTTTAPDGTIYRTYTRYNHDYDTVSNSQDPFVAVLTRMKAENIRGIPVESITTAETQPGVEQVTSATLQTYRYVTGGRLRAWAGYAIRQGLPFAYDPASLESRVNTAADVFEFDSRYEKINETRTVDKYGNITAIEYFDKEIMTTLYGYQGTLPIASISGALPENIAFSNFENRKDYDISFDEHDFTYSRLKKTDSSPLVNNGRAGGYCYNLQPGPAFDLSKEINKAEATSRYILSCWTQGAAATLSATVSDASGNSLTSALTIAGGGEWKYYELPVDVSALDSVFTLTVSADTAILVDDIAFYPETAAISYVSFDTLLLKRAETDDSGKSIYYEYNQANEPVITRDEKQRILQRITRKKAGAGTDLKPVIVFDDKIIVGTDHTFRLINTALVEGATFYWDTVSISRNPPLTNLAAYDFSSITGITDDNSFTCNFATMPDEDVAVVARVDYNGNTYYAGAIIEQRKFAEELFDFDICYGGQTEIDLCGLEANFEHSCSSITNIPNTTRFYVSVSGGQAGDYDEIRWYKTNYPLSKVYPNDYVPINTETAVESVYIGSGNTVSISNYDQTDMYILLGLYKNGVKVATINKEDVQTIRVYYSQPGACNPTQ